MQGQKFHFVHYGVEDGLAQSQVSGISQDSSHYLWIATLGGISRFDGTHFVNYTTAHGLMGLSEVASMGTVAYMTDSVNTDSQICIFLFGKMAVNCGQMLRAYGT